MEAEGGTSASMGQLVPYSTGRSHTGGIIRVKVNAWPSSPAAAAAVSAIRLSLRRASGTAITSTVQINRGQTGYVNFRTIAGSTNIPAGTFYISGRARGICNYSTPGGYVYDPVGDAFTWSGTIQYSLGAT